MNEAFIKDCLSDLWTIHLTLIGIDLSVMTLLYSFILSKKDELKLTTEKIKLGNTDPLCKRKQKFAINYINRMHRINVRCFYMFFALSILTIGSWLGWRILQSNVCKWDFMIISISTVLVIIYILYLLFTIVRQYKNDIKI